MLSDPATLVALLCPLQSPLSLNPHLWAPGLDSRHVRPKSVPVQSDRVSVGRLCKVLSLRLEGPAGGAVETVGTREEADLLDNQLGSSRNRTLHEIGPQGFLRVFPALLSILAISVIALSQLKL